MERPLLTENPLHFVQYPYGICSYVMGEEGIGVVMTEGDMSKPAIDTWLQATLEIWPILGHDRPIFGVYDLGPQQGYTPYAAQKIRELYQVAPDTQSFFIAVSLPRKIVAVLMNILFGGEFAHQYRQVTLQITDNPASAVAWLKTQKGKFCDETSYNRPDCS